jgi:thioredoxin-like negative regulator of GroEL
MTWVTGLGYTLWWIWRCHPERHRGQIDQLYREATEHYLQGRWNEARRRFEQILAMDETDADALMQLGTLFVRTDQPTLARRTFRQCLELESGAKWRWEISQVLLRLDGV